MTPQIERAIRNIGCPRCNSSKTLSFNLAEEVKDNDNKLFRYVQLTCSNCGPFIVENLALNVEVFSDISKQDDNYLESAVDYLVNEIWLQSSIQDPFGDQK